MTRRLSPGAEFPALIMSTGRQAIFCKGFDMTNNHNFALRRKALESGMIQIYYHEETGCRAEMHKLNCICEICEMHRRADDMFDIILSRLIDEDTE